jgi:hypothetical protein
LATPEIRRLHPRGERRRDWSGDGQGVLGAHGHSFAHIATLLAQYKVDAVITNKTTPPKTPTLAAWRESSSQPGTGHKVILSVDAELNCLWGRAPQRQR